MTQRGLTIKEPLNILSDDEVERIHVGTLEVLESTGVVFENKKALEILDSWGCNVDFEKQLVRFPSYLVEESIRRCPSSFTIQARHPDYNLRVGGQTLYFGPFVGMETLDWQTNRKRSPTTEDARNGVKVIDFLDNLQACYGPYFSFADVPPVMTVPTQTAILFRNTPKPTMGLSGFDAEVWQIKMAQATGQELIGNVGSAPPLTWSDSITTAAFRYIDSGFPIIPVSGLNFGANSPATLAGSLILNNAELLSMITLIQLVKPGTRIIAANYSQPMDMRTSQPLLGSIEKALAGMAFAQMWRYYHVPSFQTVSSDAKLPDYQCGYEKSMALLLQALAGYSILAVAGTVYDELMWSPVMAIIDNDVIGSLGRILQGIEVNDETMAVDLIREVGPIPGHYLNTSHTRKWWKHELFLPVLADRLSYPEWINAGSMGILERAKIKFDEIIVNHQPLPLSEEQEKAVSEILEEAEIFYKEHGML
jgi:trimethylamine--corrinoid protein Co-methyltransferase